MNITPVNDPLLQSPRLSVVIVNYNAWADVAGLVQSLANTPEVRSASCEIVVVDNASEGPIPEALRNPPMGARLVLRDENGGFAVGVNAGWRASHARWLLLLNPDVEAGPDLLRAVLDRLDRFDREASDEPKTGIVGFALRNPDGTRQPSVGSAPDLVRTILEQLIPRSRRKYQPAWRTRPGPVAWVTGACLLIRAQVLESTAGLDEDFFLYYEEVALCRTARTLGWRVLYDPGIEVVHLRPLQNRRITPRMRVITRHSKLLYFRKHLPRWQFLALCGVVLVEARVVGSLARLRNRPVEARASRTVAKIVRSLRAGTHLGGRDVLALADAVDRPEETARPAPQPRRSMARKDGPACRDHPEGSRSSP